MNPDGGAVPQTFKIASPDDKKSPSEPVAGEPATVALPKMGENPIPPKAVASSKISSRILGAKSSLTFWIKSSQTRKACRVERPPESHRPSLQAQHRAGPARRLLQIH